MGMEPLGKPAKEIVETALQKAAKRLEGTVEPGIETITQKVTDAVNQVTRYVKDSFKKGEIPARSAIPASEWALKEITDPKAYLDETRAILQRLMARGKSSSFLQKYMTRRVDYLLQAYFQKALRTSGLGKPPTEFSLVALGSYGRAEMTPFSDLDFGILIKESSPAAVDYFQRLARIVRSEVEKLGESRLKPGDIAGIRFCDGGVNPTRKEFIGTPEEFAERITESWFHLAILDARPIGKDRGLFQAFLQERERVLRRMPALFLTTRIPERNAVPGKTVKDQEVQLALREGYQKYPVIQSVPAAGTLDLKRQLLREANFVVEALSLAHDIQATHTTGRIEQLIARGDLDPTVGKRLREALDFITGLRIGQDLKAMKGELDTIPVAVLTPEEKKELARHLITLQEVHQMAKDMAIWRRYNPEYNPFSARPEAHRKTPPGLPVPDSIENVLNHYLKPQFDGMPVKLNGSIEILQALPDGRRPYGRLWDHHGHSIDVHISGWEEYRGMRRPGQGSIPAQFGEFGKYVDITGVIRMDSGGRRYIELKSIDGREWLNVLRIH